MIDKEQLMQVAQSNPKIQQAVDAIEQQIGQVPPEMIDDIIHVLELALEDPSQYPKLRQMAIEQGFADEQSIPPEFDPIVVISMLVAFYELQARGQRQPQMPMAPTGTMPQFAQGGLARHAQTLQSMGRGGDTMLAHINPREAAVLARMGGSGTVNPNTGLTEFKGGGISGIFKAVLPIALNFIAPGMGTALGAALGATGTWGGIVGNALLGGASTALGGGDFLKGAALGGLGAGGGDWLGGAVNSATGLGLGQAATSALGSGLAGGALGALSGKGFAQGALQGAAGNYLGGQLGAMGQGAVGTGLAAAGKNFGNMMTAGYDPKTSLIGGALSGVATGMFGAPKPSSQVVGNLKGVAPTDAYGTVPSATPDAISAPGGGPAPQGGLGSLIGGDMSIGKLLAGAQVLGALQGAPEPVQQAVSTMSPEQQEYFNRPSITWNWDQLQKDAAASGQDLSNYMSQNWNKVTAGQYNNPPKLARGGALNAMALGGRSDTIDAKLSPGEYVMDAETMALLGNGSVDSGAKKMDELRSSIRAHKGKALARGKISPNAKSPLAYMKGVA